MLPRRTLLALAPPALGIALGVALGAGLAAGPAAAQMAAQNGFLIEHAWARATPPTSPSSVVYLTIINNHADDTLVHVNTTVASMATLHQTRFDNGIMHMLPVDSIPIAEGTTLSLKPGGYHIMLTGLLKPLKAGMHFPLTLVFADAGAITVQVRVEKAGASNSDDTSTQKKPGGTQGADPGKDGGDPMGGMKMP